MYINILMDKTAKTLSQFMRNQCMLIHFKSSSRQQGLWLYIRLQEVRKTTIAANLSKCFSKEGFRHFISIWSHKFQSCFFGTNFEK